MVKLLNIDILEVKSAWELDCNREVIIVDEFTGRLSEGRRWSDGLHQAV
jgi:hypothetical protein